MSHDPQTDLRFRKLYDDFYQSVFALFMRRRYTRQRALELTQDTFLRVYKGMDGYREEGRWAWIQQIAYRVYLNDRRFQHADRRNFLTVPLDDLVNSPKAAAEAPRAESELLQDEHAEQLRRAIDTLSADKRRCVRLWIEGYKYREIAEILKISMDTVKSRLYQARKRLKIELERGSGDAGPPSHPEHGGDQ